MKDFKYKTSFSAVIKPLVSEEKDKYLAMASLLDVGEFIPDIDTKKNIDLLPIAFNACVVNRANKNGDAIDTETALDIYQSFINKPINIEHNRKHVIGTILTAGFSEFGTDKPLSEEEVKDRTEPFNVTLGGVVWKIVNDGLSQIIEESADPTSENYMKVSASWELGFHDYHILVIDNDNRNIADAELITDEKRIDELKENLKTFGGSGRLEDNRNVYRKVINDVVPLGIGLTESPAADVKGVATEKVEKSTTKPEKELDSSSQKTKNNVNKEEIKRIIMKIESIKDITDESLQTLSASAVSDFIEDELKKASENFSAEKSKFEDQLKEHREKATALETSQEQLKSDLESAKESLEKLETERAAKEAEEKFNQRMSIMDEEYVLSNEDRQIIVNDVKDMVDEDFETYSKKMSVLLSAKKRETVEAAAKTEVEAEAPKEVEEKTEEVAEVETIDATSEEVSEIVEQAVEGAEVDKGMVPNSIDATEPDVYDRYKKAFSLDQFDLSL